MNIFTKDLINLLNVKKVDDFLFQAECTQVFGNHLFGGQLLGQALVAAAKTTNRVAHSLHGYFIQSGITTKPILYQVNILQDGKSFSRREVKAIQNGKVIFMALASFCENESGQEFQSKDQPDYPNPESLKSEQEHKKAIINDFAPSAQALFLQPFQLEIHPINFLNPLNPPDQTTYAEYFKTYGKIEDEIDTTIMHQAIAAYYSDYNLLSVSLLPHRLSYLSNNIQSASLDHIIYFHHKFRVDEWSLYELSTSTSSQGKGLNYGQIWQNKKLVCSTIQESLMRYQEQA